MRLTTWEVRWNTRDCLQQCERIRVSGFPWIQCSFVVPFPSLFLLLLHISSGCSRLPSQTSLCPWRDENQDWPVPNDLSAWILCGFLGRFLATNPPELTAHGSFFETWSFSSLMSTLYDCSLRRKNTRIERNWLSALCPAKDWCNLSFRPRIPKKKRRLCFPAHQ